MFEYPIKSYIKNVVSLQLEVEKCDGCRLCVTVCPRNVFEVTERKAHIIRLDHCIECGACMMNCAEGAIFVKSGVGCAAGVINGMIRGTEPSCDCGEGCC
ncbi:MAG: mercury methylation ferredoxin HgcB [Bacteroidetes bacterium]|nr:mercury methylation ferredoxin HgcB [Bacteroidota bacterium]